MNAAGIPPRQGIFSVMHRFSRLGGARKFLLPLIIYRQTQNATALYAGLPGNFSHMIGQGILPRLSKFSGETGKLSPYELALKGQIKAKDIFIDFDHLRPGDFKFSNEISI